MSHCRWWAERSGVRVEFGLLKRNRNCSHPHSLSSSSCEPAKMRAQLDSVENAEQCCSSAALAASQRSSTSRMHVRCVVRPTTRSTMLVCVMVSLLVIASCLDDVDARVYVVKYNPKPLAKKCRVHVNTPLHVLMDRICLACHEMFSHEHPNMRAECSSNCYKSQAFRKCLNVFAPKELGNILKEVNTY